MLLEQMIDLPFDFSSLLVYLSGILSGFILACLIYFILVLLSIRKSKRIIKACEDNINEEDVRIMIQRAKDNYLLLNNSKDVKIKETAFKETCFNLVNDIASKCFPKSKNPMLELSIDESLLLAKYIIQRIEELLSKKGLSLVKKISIAKIRDILVIKKKVDNNAIIKGVKKYSKITKIGITVANVIAKPFKIIGSTAKNFLVSKIILLTISIVGEETYKIYTKQAIKSMDPEYVKFMEELNNEIEEEVEAK